MPQTDQITGDRSLMRTYFHGFYQICGSWSRLTGSGSSDPSEKIGSGSDKNQIRTQPDKNTDFLFVFLQYFIVRIKRKNLKYLECFLSLFNPLWPVYRQNAYSLKSIRFLLNIIPDVMFLFFVVIIENILFVRNNTSILTSNTRDHEGTRRSNASLASLSLYFSLTFSPFLSLNSLFVSY